jgi:hypothetical protein
MSDNFEQVEDVDGRLSDAVRQLRAQHQLIAAMNCKSRNVEAFLPLLSDALRQYFWLRKQRKMVIQRSNSS